MRLAVPMPAQLTRMRAGPWSAAALAIAASVEALSATSQAIGDAVDVDRHLGGGFGVDIEDGDFRAGRGQHARRRGAEA